MITKINFICHLSLSVVLLSLGVALTACSDDDSSSLSGLFRPVINESDNITHGLDDNLSPYMIVKWDNYTSANQYVIKIEANDGTDTREQAVDTTFYRFDNLKYDKEYNISLRAKNTVSGLESKDFTLTTTSLDYPTSLLTPSSSDIIDTQTRIKWSGTPGYDKLMVYKESNDSLVAEVELSADDLDAGEYIVRGLSPRTSYRVEAFAADNYLGKKRFSTVAAENYSGVVFDLRSLDADESKGYITTDQLAADVAANPGEDITYVLQGGVTYAIKGGTTLPGTEGKIKFVTGLTLAGNAVFRSGGGIGLTSGQNVGEAVFEKINFVSDKALDGYEVPTNTDKGWGGRQVFNINGVSATLGKLTFKSCTVTGYRAMVRAQQDKDNINRIVVTDCQINGVGDQGVFTTTNKNCDWQSIEMKNCTVTNIVMLCDLRQTTGTLNFTIEDCTFCYAPIETTANANTPMFRLGDGNVNLTVKNTLFGPSMATEESAGGKLKTYTAGVAGSIFLSGTPNTLDVQDSWKTNFEWTNRTPDAETPTINPLEGLGETGLSETQLWSNPAAGVFTVIGSTSGVDLKKLGDDRWK